MIESLQGGYQAQAISYGQKGTSVNGQSQPVSSGDNVSLSEGGRLLSDFFSGMGVELSPGGSVSLADLEAGVKEKQQALQDSINALFLENDISTSPPVNLTTDDEGHVRVSGDHPQKAEIEAAFEKAPELVNNFRAVSGQSSLVAAGDEYIAFAELYKNDPYAAVNQYAHLFSDTAYGEYSLTIEGDAATSTEGAVGQVERPDFTNSTRKELMDWVNSEISNGRMTVKESIPFASMTLGPDVDSKQGAGTIADTAQLDFAQLARDGLEGALFYGDAEVAQQLQHALDIMGG